MVAIVSKELDPCKHGKIAFLPWKIGNQETFYLFVNGYFSLSL